MGRCKGLDLFYDSLARINLIDYSKETSQFSLVAWHRFQLLNKVVSALSCKECQLVNICAISFLSELQRVLLNVKSAEQLVNWQARQVRLVNLNELVSRLSTSSPPSSGHWLS